MAVAGVQHHWAVTRGNNPDTKPYYCPLHEARHFAAVTLYERLIQPVPDNASDYWTRLADMAVVIPEQEASFFYQLSLLAKATWTPVDHDTDLDAILRGRPGLGQSHATGRGRSPRRQVRLPEHTNAALDAYIEKHGTTASAVIRDAVEAYLSHENTPAA